MNCLRVMGNTCIFSSVEAGSGVSILHYTQLFTVVGKSYYLFQAAAYHDTDKRKRLW